MANLQVELIQASDYFQALISEIPKAKKRIVIHAMVILWGPRTEILVPLLKDALAKGVEVLIVGDYYSKFQANRPKIIRVTPKWSHTRAINYGLEAMGAHITYISKVGLNPYKGRCHSKITIIDDTAYTFGGVNFSDTSFDNYDYMLRLKDKATTDQLHELVLTIEKDRIIDNVVNPLPGIAGDLLFDGGASGSSIIYDTACKVVAGAEKVYYVSQMCPSGRLAKYIESTENYCYFIRPSQTDTPANLALMVDKARYGIKNLYKGKGYIHAKFILCEYADGSKHLLSGSNNFSWRGIAYGTREIAIHSTDPKLWQQLYDYMNKTIVAKVPEQVL
jgi:cardiolipin synthase